MVSSKDRWEKEKLRRKSSMDAFDIKQQCKKILFLHGFTSGGDCEISHTLMDALQGEVEVVSPDLPLMT